MLKDLQRKTDKYVIWARELSSRGMSFMIVMLGVLLQASHTTLLMYSISAFSSSVIRFMVSLGIGIFISSALAIFTLKHDGGKASLKIINTFFYFEIFTNIFYFWNSLVFVNGFAETSMQQWLYLIIAMPFAYIMPYTIKKFAGIIASDRTLDFGSLDEKPMEVDEDGFNDRVKDLEDNFKKYTELQISDNNQEILQETHRQIEEKLGNLKLEQYLKRGSKIKLSLNGKSSIVTLE